MDADIKDMIDGAKDTISHGYADGDVLLRLLKLDPHSSECEYLGQATGRSSNGCLVKPSIFCCQNP